MNYLPHFFIKNTITSLTKFNFHVSKNSRIRYNFEKEIFSVTGDLIVADFRQARIIAQKINNKREADNHNAADVTAGQVNALCLLHELMHLVFRFYEQTDNPDVFANVAKHLLSKMGNEKFDKLILSFTEEFPPLEVYSGKFTAMDWLKNENAGKPNVEIIIEELIILHFENLNPLFPSFKEFYDEKIISDKAPYKEFIDNSREFFKEEKHFSALNKPIFDLLEETILEKNSTIEQQFFGFNKMWALVENNSGVAIVNPLWNKVLAGTDLLREDAHLFTKKQPVLANQPNHDSGAKPTPPVPTFKFDQKYFEEMLRQHKKGIKPANVDEVDWSFMVEEEKFTIDKDWMPNVVMIAKNSLVWLDQLSKKYRREIRTLDLIPDEELDKLARWNFTSLWLIGVWERSKASQKIKQFCGNPEAASSAYSLFDYEIAQELGGRKAFENLKERCILRGIRVASDMVPNHTGIFSRWIIENPDYFIQCEESPYPNYTFTGPDLSDDSRVEIRIEDKYYTRQDAAVVFQLKETINEKIRYVYHGNDGTNMAWNDTAQLNLLNPDLKEALIQTILRVARDFPIIRFDAAMILAKKHYQRLWYPEPGSGGAVPSRSDFAMTRETFHSLLPAEFWREVVDRINTELPNTLLLAEAFWLLEGYFVRTLGMHRVYNSAFMHMFMKEENDKYRQVIKNTVDFDAEILKRYVNFMSNPDEETAVNQFGKGDKYFGIVVMMVTLPGLPMFAHGQVEGFTEKYGMEYKRAYYEEAPDNYLIARHERELFPLLKKRYLFSQVENFELYDFIEINQIVDENVFAFSNRIDEDRALVFFNNSFRQTKGRIRFSTGKGSGIDLEDLESGVLDFEDESVRLKKSKARTQTIMQALKLRQNESTFITFRETRTNLEYIRHSKEINEAGFELEIKGYEYFVFLNFKEIVDSSGEYSKLAARIKHSGVPSIASALQEMNLEPLHSALTQLFKKKTLSEFAELCGLNISDKPTELLELAKKPTISENSILSLIGVFQKIEELRNVKFNKAELIKSITDDFENANSLNSFLNTNKKQIQKASKFTLDHLPLLSAVEHVAAYKSLVVIYIVINRVLSSTIPNEAEGNYSGVYQSLLLDMPIWQSMIRLGDTYSFIRDEFELIKIIAMNQDVLLALSADDSGLNPSDSNKKQSKEIENIKKNFVKLLKNSGIRDFVYLHQSEGIYYFNKERFELLLKLVYSIDLIRRYDKAVRASKLLAITKAKSKPVPIGRSFSLYVAALSTFIGDSTDASVKSGYIFDEFVELLNNQEKQKTKVELNEPVKKKTSKTPKKSTRPKKTSAKKVLTPSSKKEKTTKIPKDKKKSQTLNKALKPKKKK